MKYNYYERNTNIFICSSTENTKEFIETISFRNNIPVKDIMVFPENPELPNDDVVGTEV